MKYKKVKINEGMLKKCIFLCVPLYYWNDRDKSDKIINPNNCQSSCANKSRDCVACTNEDYYKCKVSGQCVHPALRCDGHRQCKYGEDEENCFEEYKNNARKEATYICENFLNITTFARVCDGNW